MFGRKNHGIYLHISSRKCIGCEICAHICINKVIGMMYKNYSCHASVEYINRCVGCGKCVNICPGNAIELIKNKELIKQEEI